jgi:hypothetical protein
MAGTVFSKDLEWFETGLKFFTFFYARAYVLSGEGLFLFE